MRFSIAVPSLDYGVFLEACLGSIARQSHRDFEVLIADGGSRDDSLDIARRFARADARFTLVSTADDGQASAVQKAFERSSGDVFGYLNADDVYLHDDVLARVAAAFEQSGADLVSFGGCYLDANGKEIAEIRLRRHPRDTLARIRYRASVIQPATFWRRAVQQAIPFRTEFHYVFDSVFFCEAARRFEWREFEGAIAGYRLHGDNKSMGVRADRVREIAAFEAIKFGPGSFRARYVRSIARLVEMLDGGARVGALKHAVRLGVNGLSFASGHRLPGI